MSERLHLGCGDEYRPGWVNVDMYDTSVADVVGDVIDLPFESGSIDQIEADHLLEHFDYVHCRYVLSEWFRVLRKGGNLVLETPDISAAFKSLISSRTRSRVGEIQWIYGIDSPGLQHRTGFTFTILKDLLEETGFVEVSREKQETHTYEAGLRIRGTKGEHAKSYDFRADLRREILHQLPRTDSSLLVPIEDHINPVLRGFDPTSNASVARVEEHLAELTVSAVPLGLAFLETCARWSLTNSARAELYRASLKYLEESRFIERACSLWAKNRKGRDLESDFRQFRQRLKASALRVLTGKISATEEFRYLLSLSPSRLELLDLNLLLLESRKMFNEGVKHFSEGRLAEAKDAFEGALALHPTNPLAYWNLARIESATSGQTPTATQLYDAALEHSALKMKRAISKELELLRSGEPTTHSKPVTERWGTG